MEPVRIELRVHRWVIWWVCLGILGGAIAIANIVGHRLSAAQEEMLITFGVAFWLLGGIFCWALEGIRVDSPFPTPPAPGHQRVQESTREYHPASDFLLPGNRRSILPWRH
jgi:hypothetical protein